MIKPTKFLALLFLTLASAQGFASKDPCPEITKESLAGEWEAVYTASNVRVFRLEFNPRGRSFLYTGISTGPSSTMSLVSELQQASVERGKVRLLFSTEEPPVKRFAQGRLPTTKGEKLLSGSGNVCGQDGGILDAELVMEPDSPTPRVWPLHFIKSVDGVSLTELLMQLHKATLPAQRPAHR